MTTTNKTDWWREDAGFFGPEYLRQYEGTILTADDTVQEVDFIESALSLRPGPELEILDVPCGHGRHSIELAARGYLVTGYDLNRYFLRKAWEVSEEEAVPAVFQQGDMRELPFVEQFDVALNLFTAMGYFEDDAEDEKFFAGVQRALKPGGKFLVDYLNRDRLIRNFTARDWRELPDGSIVLTERKYDITSGHMHDRRITFENNKVVREVDSTLRFYAPHELIAMADRVGLSFLSAYGDFTGKPLTIDSKRAILIFERSS